MYALKACADKPLGAYCFEQVSRRRNCPNQIAISWRNCVAGAVLHQVTPQLREACSNLEDLAQMHVATLTARCSARSNELNLHSRSGGIGARAVGFYSNSILSTCQMYHHVLIRQECDKLLYPPDGSCEGSTLEIYDSTNTFLACQGGCQGMQAANPREISSCAASDWGLQFKSHSRQASGQKARVLRMCFSLSRIRLQDLQHLRALLWGHGGAQNGRAI